jgi:hypothetical protein
MAIRAISKQDVFSAADTLVAAGKAPTYKAIREVLGGGSESTIAKHIKDWRETQSTTPAKAFDPAQFPESILKAIMDVIKDNEIRIQNELGERIVALMGDCEEHVATQARLEQQLSDLQTNLGNEITERHKSLGAQALLRDQIAKFEIDLATERAARREAETAAAELKGEVRGRRQTLTPAKKSENKPPATKKNTGPADDNSKF